MRPGPSLDPVPGGPASVRRDDDMRNKINLAMAMLMLGAPLAYAQSNEQQITSDLTAQGFGDIEFQRDDGQLEVEAWRGDQKVEITYDLSTGDVVKNETETVAGGKAADDRDEARDDRDMNDDDDDDRRDRDDARDDDDPDDANDDDHGQDDSSADRDDSDDSDDRDDDGRDHDRDDDSGSDSDDDHGGGDDDHDRGGHGSDSDNSGDDD